MQKAYQDYMLEQVARLMTIPAVSGYSGPMERYLAEQTRLLGYAPTLLRQGGVVAELLSLIHI